MSACSVCGVMPHDGPECHRCGWIGTHALWCKHREPSAPPRQQRPRRNEHGGLFALDPAKCPATFDVPLVLDDYDGPEPITHQCQQAPGHQLATPHSTTVQWLSEEDE